MLTCQPARRRESVPESGIDLNDRILLVGPANVGKSSLFSGMTKTFATISNYPGTTVEVAHARLGDSLCLDTPGMTGLLPGSEEEAVTLRCLLEATNKTVVVVVDARDLRRSLSLVMALSEFDHRFVVALNMFDEARDLGLDIDVKGLEELLGVPVVPTIAVSHHGISTLRRRLKDAAPFKIKIEEPADLASAVNKTSDFLGSRSHPKVRARLALAGSPEFTLPCDKLTDIKDRLRRTFGVSASALFARHRAQAAQNIAERVVTQASRNSSRFSAWFGEAAVHRFWGWPVLAGILYLLYEIVGVFAAGELVDMMESIVFGEYVLPSVDFMLALLPAGAIREFLTAPDGGAFKGLLMGPYGLISMGFTYAVAIILPVVFFFFMGFALMEDSGYLPRLAIMLDRPFRILGLNGRAVLPLVLGLGCDTMATMTTRILPTQKERTLVIFLLALAIPCSAQLGVLAALAAVLSGKGMFVWVAVVIGVLFLAGIIGSRLIPGSPAPFLMEVPPIRRPRLGNVLSKTLARTEWYLREAVPLFLFGTALLWLFDSIHLLGIIEQAMAPVVVGMLGLPEAAAVAFLMGFLRRDYGAAGLFSIFAPSLAAGTAAPGTEVDLIVSMVTITLFIPCVANFLVIAKEKGTKSAIAVGVLTTMIAISAGWGTRIFLAATGWV